MCIEVIVGSLEDYRNVDLKECLFDRIILPYKKQLKDALHPRRSSIS
jgi:hypothetical protein